MKYYSGNFPSFQQIPKQHNAHVLAYTLHRMDFEQMEMRVASFGSYTEKMDSMFRQIARSPTSSFEPVAASMHEAKLHANHEKPVTQDTNTDQTYKKRKHIPNNTETQKDRKAKLLAKNKFFK